MQKLLEKVVRKEHLLYEEMIEAAQFLFDDDTPTDWMQNFLVALSQKGETAHEVAALATVMRSFALDVNAPAGKYLDNCGTGGDGLNSFNISTTASFVLASGGVQVAKHGNRKISSSSGSSDVLEALGIHTQFSIEQMMQLLAQEDLSFIYAPNVHPKLRRIGEVRRAIGKPTIFNLVGPLTNPVELYSQYTGINRPNFVMEYASVLRMLGRERAIIVSGDRGMDEASLSGQNTLILLDRGNQIPFSLTAENVGLPSYPLEAIRGGDAAENAVILRKLLEGEQSAYFDTVLLNAGIGFFAYGTVDKIRDGIEYARELILSGKALKKLDAVIAFSQKIQLEASV